MNAVALATAVFLLLTTSSAPASLGTAACFPAEPASRDIAEDGLDAFCGPSRPTVPLQISGHVTGGGQVTVSWPGFMCALDVVNIECPTARVPANSTIRIDFWPNFTGFGRGQVFYGIYTVPSNESCALSNNAVWGPISCSFRTGEGGSLAIYAPRCTTETGWTTC